MLILPFLILTRPVHSLAQSEIHMNDLKGKWKINGELSEFKFKIRNTWIFNVKGTMDGISGTIDFDKKNTPDFVRLYLKPATISTGINKRDEHLKSEDFFYTDKFPKIIFKGGKLNVVHKSEKKYEVKGTLTIRGITYEKTVPIKLKGYYMNDKNKIEFTGSTKVERKKYNVDYTGMIIGNTAKVKYKIVAEKEIK